MQADCAVEWRGVGAWRGVVLLSLLPYLLLAGPVLLCLLLLLG